MSGNSYRSQSNIQDWVLAKMVNGWKPFTICIKCSILDVWIGLFHTLLGSAWSNSNGKRAVYNCINSINIYLKDHHLRVEVFIRFRCLTLLENGSTTSWDCIQFSIDNILNVSITVLVGRPKNIHSTTYIICL